jgi:hypothetical protein
MLKYSNRLSGDKKTNAKTLIRTEFRLNKETRDSAAIDALVAKAQSSLGYLKMVTPRRATDEISSISTTAAAKRPTKAISNWTGMHYDLKAVPVFFQYCS